MTQRMFPVADDPLPEADWEIIASQWQDIGVIGSPGDGTLEVSAAGGMSVEVAIGTATISGFGYETDAAVTVSAIPTEATDDRVDWIVVKLDRAGPTTVVARVAGTPGAGAPSLTSPPSGMTYLPLAKVTSRGGATSILASDVVDGRWYVGARIQAVRSGYLPAVTAGRMLYQTDTGRVLLGTASAWVEIVGPGSRAALGVVTDGLLKYTTGGEILNTAVVAPSWGDVGSLGQIVLPGTLGRLYKVVGDAPVSQGEGHLAIRDSAGVVLGQGGNASEGENAQVTAYYVGTGSAKTVKLSGRKKTGTVVNFRLQGVSTAQPVVLYAEDAGLST